MSPGPILFNKIFAVVKENNEFFISERNDKKNLFPIFDLPNKNWCLVKKSRDKKWLMLFYKKSVKNSEKIEKEIFYISFAKENFSNETIFINFKEVEKGGFDEKWMKKI